MGLFGKSQQKSPKEMVQEWTSKIRREGNQLERQIRAIQREEEKVKRSLKDAAKKGEKDACRILAKEILGSRKAVNKLYAAKAQLNSIQMGMKNQLATLRIAGALEKSTAVMSSMQQLIKVPEIQATMRDMSKEMMKAGIIEMLEHVMEELTDISNVCYQLEKSFLLEMEVKKAGIIEEMLEDTMEGLEDTDDLDEEADQEVDKVLFELTAGELGKAPAAVVDSLPAEEEGASAAVEDEGEVEDMQARLEALRS